MCKHRESFHLLTVHVKPGLSLSPWTVCSDSLRSLLKGQLPSVILGDVSLLHDCSSKVEEQRQVMMSNYFLWLYISLFLFFFSPPVLFFIYLFIFIGLLSSDWFVFLPILWVSFGHFFWCIFLNYISLVFLFCYCLFLSLC